MFEFKNDSGLGFSDISAEKFRTYTFPGGDTVMIENPTKLNVSESGGHRVFDAQMVSHYIPPRWIHLHWETKPDCPHFVK